MSTSRRYQQEELFEDQEPASPAAVSHLYTFTHLLSKEEALDLLREKRKKLISIARDLAREMGAAQGCVTTQDILQEMESRGLLNDDDRQLDQRWIGGLFSKKDFRSEFVAVGYKIQKNEKRNCHSAPRREWRFVGTVSPEEADDMAARFEARRSINEAIETKIRNEEQNFERAERFRI